MKKYRHYRTFLTKLKEFTRQIKTQKPQDMIVDVDYIPVVGLVLCYQACC